MEFSIINSVSTEGIRQKTTSFIRIKKFESYDVQIIFKLCGTYHFTKRSF